MRTVHRVAIGAIGCFCTLAAPAAADQPEDVRTLRVPDSTVSVKLWTAPGVDGEHVPHYAISLDGREFATARPTSYELKLRYGTFDPLALDAAPVFEPQLTATERTNLFIVQYVTQPLQVYRTSLRALGVEPIIYLPRHAYIVEMDAQTRDAVERLPFVRWVGPYHPAYRLEQALVDAIADRSNQLPMRRYNIMVAGRDLETKNTVADQIRHLGGAIDELNPGGRLIRASLNEAQLIDVAHLDEVLFIDRRFEPQTYMDKVRIDGGANHVETEGGYTGAGVRGEVMDTGLYTSHQDWQFAPIIHNGNSGATGHGTAVYGIVFGDGSGDPDGLGLIPDGQGIFSSFYNLDDRYQHTMELVDEPYNAVFQTNSWGSCCTTQYGTESQLMDEMIFDSGLIILQAQANDGSQNSDVSAWAKNVVSVGGIRHYDTLTRDDDAWSFAGSIGPAADGRVKPDVAYWYDSIYTTDDDGGYRPDFGGTSAATPETAGHFGLMFQMWSEGIFGNEVDPFGTVFENRPNTATAKALIINTAEPYDFSGTSDDLTRTHQGWGLANVGTLYDLREKTIVVDETDVLTNLASASYVVGVEPGEPRLKITMVYTDVPGNPGATQARVNDLTLKVVSPSGDIYWGNYGLLADNVSDPGGEPNDIDTVENVFIEEPESGVWTVEVIADEVIEDTHLETPEVDADFALVVTGGLRGPGFGLGAEPSALAVCSPESAEFDLNIERFMGYEEEITLSATGAPAGTTVSFTNNPVIPPATSTMIVSGMENADAGTYSMLVTGTAIDMERSVGLELIVSTMIPNGPALIEPVDDANNVSIVPTLVWEDVDQAASYDLEIATDANFSNVVYSTTTEDASHVVQAQLDVTTTHFWRVSASNACGESAYAEIFSFVTQDFPDILLVDDDDNSPDVRSYYGDVLDDMGVWYDVWDTENSDNEPPLETLALYEMVIWFTGDEFGGACGPGSSGESALGEWLDNYGGCLLISSQDYHWDRDLTPFMSDYLGVTSIIDDESQTQVTGEGAVFGEMGSLSLNYPFTNFSDAISGIGDGELAFDGNQGDVGVTKDGGNYHTAFLVFPIEAIPSATDREALLSAFMAWCGELEPCIGDLDDSGVVDVTDLLAVLAAWGDSGSPADLNGDGDVDVDDMLLLLAAWGPCP
jgi:hypothetical protein